MLCDQQSETTSDSTTPRAQPRRPGPSSVDSCTSAVPALHPKQDFCNDGVAYPLLAKGAHQVLVRSLLTVGVMQKSQAKFAAPLHPRNTGGVAV